MPRGKARKAPLERVLVKTLITSTCWLWQGGLDSEGYASIYVDGKAVRLHVFMYKQHKGEIPEGEVVRHTCDVRHCLNPDHLITGTQLQNVHDAIERGRAWHPVGEACHNTKLTDSVCSLLKSDYQTGLYTQQQLSERYGINRRSVGQVLKNVPLSSPRRGKKPAHAEI
jgi:hypothetical protein